MNLKIAQFIVELLGKLNIAGRDSKCNFEYELEIDEHKEYVSITLKFSRHNAKYSDAVLFYFIEDEFNHLEFLNSIDEAIVKAHTILYLN